ncbi:MAG: hypothetical protein WC522_04540 [Candidatus Omnitrophota bacterium]
MFKRTAIIFLMLVLPIQYIVLAQDEAVKEGENQDVKEAEAITRESISRVRPGMEVKKIGGLNLMVPEGTKFYREGAQIRMEEEGEYSARRFKEMDARLQKVENKVRGIETGMEELRKNIEAVRKSSNPDPSTKIQGQP